MGLPVNWCNGKPGSDECQLEGAREVTTLRDVARQAGVSAMTVSNVVNGRAGKVSEETLARVRTAIDELGYVPNAQARALAGSASRVLALVYDAVPSRAPLSAPYESIFVGACERAAREAGYALMLCGTSDAGEVAGRLRAWGVDGAIVMATTRTAPEQFLKAAQVPSVFIDYYGTAPDAPFVDVDDQLGAALVGERFAELGHRRILFVGPEPLSSEVVRRRLEGLRDGVVHAGGDAASVSVAVADVTFAEGVRVARTIVARGADSGARPTAVLASGDVLALGILVGLQEGKLAVPGDVSVVGFDGLELSRYCAPPLHTIVQPIEGKAEEAVSLLVQSAEQGVPAASVVLPVAWREGGSLGAAPAETSR